MLEVLEIGNLKYQKFYTKFTSEIPMVDNLEEYIGGASNLYTAFGVEFGKFAMGKLYEKLTSPGPKITDAFVLGFYLPWLIFSKGLSDSDIPEDKHRETLFEILTLESYVFEAATNLKLDKVDRDYVYHIQSNALIEKHSISQRLSDENLIAFNFGISLSESVITFSDSENRNRCIKEAGIYANELRLDGDVVRTVSSLKDRYCQTDLFNFMSQVDRLAQNFIETHGV